MKSILVRCAAVASVGIATVTFAIGGQTAWAAPQGSCTTGSYSESTVGSDSVGTFSAPSSATSTGCTWTVPAGVTSVRVLVVGGGGGGGGYLTSGGGGAGGVIHEVGFAVTPGASLSVTVGKGGGPGTNAWNQPGNYNNGANGDNSVFGSLTAVGGGGGGGGGTNSQIGNPGSTGGSGGGGGRCWVTCNTSLVSVNGTNKHAGGAGTAGQGNNGGNAPFMSGGGGGGAGAAGSVSTGGAAGAGGDGISVDISGSATYYGGGGGGGSENTSSRAAGGLGGGGMGGATGSANGDAGVDGTGGGGGGTRDGSAATGGAGAVIVRWGTAPVAPAISLSNSSGWTIVNTAASSLYNITNTGGAVTSYSIAPSLPAGLTFDTSTGLISGTPTALSSATNYTITARRVSSSNGASSSDSATFNYAVTTVAPTTTTTSSTTTTVAATTTTAVSTQSTVPSTSSSVAQAGPVITPVSIAPSSSSSSSVPVIKSAAAAATTTTSTTVPVTTTTVVEGPQAPDASPGEGVAVIDGKEAEAQVTRLDNALVVSAGDLNATIYGLTADGQRVALNTDGNLALRNGDTVVVEASGYAADGLLEVWLHSTPVQLGVMTVGADGAAKGSFVIPESVSTGDHRVLLSGSTKSGRDSVIGVGLRIGSWGKESNVSRWIILSTIVLAVTLALVIPTTARRRRKTLNA